MADPEQMREPSEKGRVSLTRAMRAMGRMLPRTSAQPSTPTRTPVHLGKNSSIVDCGLYVDGVRQAGQWHYAEALEQAREKPNAFVWIGLHDPAADELGDIADTFDLHELAVEDALKAYQRPKLERYGEMTFVAVRTARYVPHPELTATSEVVETGNVMMFVGEHFAVTVRHGDACKLTPVRASLEARPELLAQGPWSVAHAILDSIVDVYLDVANAVEGDIDELEESVFDRSTGGGTDIQHIYQLKRELLEFKRAVFPLQRPLAMLVDNRVPGVPAETRRYLRDVADHLLRVSEQLTGFDDLLNSILHARLAQVTIDQNNDMRKMAAWAAIFGAETVIAGIYGMNFDHMPETKWIFGYPAILIFMLCVVVFMYRLFRRSGWL